MIASARNTYLIPSVWVLSLAAAGLVDGYMHQGVYAATDWTYTLPDGELKNDVVGHTARRLASLDPKQYADWPLSPVLGEAQADAGRGRGSVLPGRGHPRGGETSRHRVIYADEVFGTHRSNRVRARTSQRANSYPM